MTKKYASISDVKDYVGQEVTIGAWVANKSGKGKIAFLQLRDGSAFFQAVAFKPNFIERFGEEEGADKFDTIKRLSQETSVFVKGIVKEDERSKFGYELDVTDIEVIGESQDYPITPKEHGTDFLMDNRHLWLRSRRQAAIMQIRNAIIYASYEFFDQNGFIKFDSPILSGNAAENTTELFETDYFGNPAFLSQSGQLYLEAGMMALGRVFDFGPVFRAEKSKTRRHLTEFWMMDAEYPFLSHEESLDLQEAYVKAMIQGVLDRAPQALETLERDTDLLKKYIAEPFKRVAYDDAISLLQEHASDEDADYEAIQHGDDFGSPHETWISNYFGVPTFVVNYPASFKAFYMKPVPGNEERVLCADLLAPEGYGEIIGGSERETDYNKLLAKIEEEGLNPDDYAFYLDLRKYGSVPHCGFGLGLERMVTFVAGTKHIREAIPFPRMLHRIKP
ncbi:asparagine--tRNA ligase [Streptococcus dysgalactiae subsp. equisimilis]|uniref:Asparagine--tRNA ligase n=3 Tax=Streptococcus dysgalactiae TaxID=1334 RepID=A0A9X8T3U8_STREQ|nr:MULTISPECIES: asparagine--tRNA ligase [Streptococcus]ADX24240.1 asparaginyl-tRNA synthetase [Streptococcus dysgalactiae subsp. equisimilis ATCC 12394]EGL46380.1 asparagine--tRNA ligase [Streptococcus dysgalactiae subsp. equisimilis SK1249]EGR88281.1 asparagine--tRNA ligase [Streptococcus dysgalactiae subsp. equisimilis SK1250]BAN93121.1 asparaginyl-tRNA synthetase [Streptococcus dysgalactiae subsp. equisimilis 167]KKC17735.1 asparagine--tRNA ligase [Streptococcus dysgalactiae subsp. equisim